jgi:arginine deiminase
MRYLNTTKKLVAEVKAVQREFLKLDTYWTLIDCLDVIIMHEHVKTNSEAINGAIIELKKIDDLINESIAD